MDRIAFTTELILEVFRLNGDLLAAGDRLVADIRLSSARWQVMGAIELSPVPLPVAHIARNMGLSRQAVQRLANELAADGLVRFAPNPHHARAKLLALTDKGAAAYAQAMKRQRPWVRQLADNLPAEELTAALKVMRAMRQRLEQGGSRH